MNFKALFNSSVSLQNEILKLLSDGGLKGNDEVVDDQGSDRGQPSESIVDEIYEDSKAEPNASIMDEIYADKVDTKSERASEPLVEPNPSIMDEIYADSDKSGPNRLTGAKVLTATEIIYQAMLNENETPYARDISGGMNAENMIENILKGGDVEGKQNIVDEIFENNKPEDNDQPQSIIDEIHGDPDQFAGGAREESKFVASLKKYKSTREALNDVSSQSDSSDSGSDDDSGSDNDDVNDDVNVPRKKPTTEPTPEPSTEPTQPVPEHTPESDSESSSSDINNLPKEFVPLNKASILRKRSHSDSETESEEESQSDIDSDSSADEFIQSESMSPKYVHLIKQFKSPRSKDSMPILGGSVLRPKTITVVNAFPYILKSSPSE